MKNPLVPTLILLLLATALFLLPDGSFYHWRLAIQGAFARLHKPPEPRADAFDRIFSDDRDLLLVLQQKEAEIADLRRRLRELGAAMELVESARIVPARVVRLGPDNTLDTFTIDAGARDGVAAGQAVVAGHAVAGVVAQVGEDASLVLSLASPGCYLSARLGEKDGSADRPRILGAVRGLGGGGVAAVVFASTTPAKEGWIAMTSGLEASIPAGLILGTLEGQLRDGAESGTIEVELRPAADLDSLDFVSVLGRD